MYGVHQPDISRPDYAGFSKIKGFNRYEQAPDTFVDDNENRKQNLTMPEHNVDTLWRMSKRPQIKTLRKAECKKNHIKYENMDISFTESNQKGYKSVKRGVHEGPLGNLQASLMQQSKIKEPLEKDADVTVETVDTEKARFQRGLRKVPAGNGEYLTGSETSITMAGAHKVPMESFSYGYNRRAGFTRGKMADKYLLNNNSTPM